MTKFLILLRIGKYNAVNQLLHGSEARKKWIGQLIGLGTILVLLYLAANMAFKYADDRLGDAFIPLMMQFVSLFMTIGIVMTVRDSVEKVMANFYENDDIYLLVSSPVSVYSVVGYKYAQLVFVTLFSMVIWLFTPWIAVGRVFHAGWQFYVAMIPTLALLLLVINANVVFVFMLINRYFSSRRVVRIVKAIGIIMSSIAGIGIALFWMWGFRDQAKFVEFISKIKTPKSDWYPHVWVTNILTSFLPLPQINIEPLEWIVRLIVASVGMVALVLILGRKSYYRSWELSRMAEQAGRSAKKKKSAKSQKLVKRRGIKSSIALKDFRAMLKDKRQILMIVMLSVILFVTILQFLFRGNADSAEGIFPIIIIITMYSTIISIRLSWHAFKREGESWWLLQSSPISPATLYHAKLLLSCSVTFLYAEFWIAVAILMLKIPLHIGWLFIGIIPTMIASINSTIGTFPWIAEIGSAKDKKNPVARIVTLILTFIFVIVILAGPLLLIILSWEGDIFKSLSPVARKCLAGTIVLAFYTTITFISYFIGKKNVAKLVLG